MNIFTSHAVFNKNILIYGGNRTYERVVIFLFITTCHDVHKFCKQRKT